MSWSPEAKRDAFLILGLILPALMLGLGLGGYFLSRSIGFGTYSGIIAFVLATLGLVISLILTVRIGRKFGTPKNIIEGPREE